MEQRLKEFIEEELLYKYDLVQYADRGIIETDNFPGRKFTIGISIETQEDGSLEYYYNLFTSSKGDYIDLYCDAIANGNNQLPQEVLESMVGTIKEYNL